MVKLYKSILFFYKDLSRGEWNILLDFIRQKMEIRKTDAQL